MSDEYTRRAENEDWLRTRSWDLPTSFDAFVSFVARGEADPAKQAAALQRFLTLPAAQAMPNDLRRAVVDHLGRHTPPTSRVRRQ